jgi:soluble lytic murein transglycosylase-like protein
MKWILALVLSSEVISAQAVPASPDSARSTVASSIEQQRASVQKQVTSVTGKTTAPGSFFTVPWVDGMASRFVPPPCDAMATQDLDQLIEKNSKEQGVKQDLIRAVINQESGNRPCAVSSKGAQGLMQLMPETASELGVGDPFNAKQNVEGGTKLLKTLLAKYKGDVALTLAAYNAGSGRVDRDGGIPDIPETMAYVTQILARLPKR